ncbi:GSCOCT00003952001.2-RA-CDS [Cotesia congregata]|uniref:Cc_odve66_7 n=1 Tax=Cotesia congregata TaxID=51543 RepID=A0A8J2MK81_COTCN|nr:GSCOCT00003952001.2-RA-CDS [Cotesia congregata]CAG5081634.1 Cc_odve66_7 [Cotesia congregata]
MNGDLDSQIETKAEKRDILDREISRKVLTNIDLDSQIIKKTGEYTRLKNLVVEKTQASKTIDVQIQKKDNKYNRLDGKILEKTKINDDLDSQIKTKADKRDLLDREISVKTQANDDLDSQIIEKTKECTRLENLVLEKKHISKTVIIQIEKKNKEVSLLDADVNKKLEVLKMLNHSIDTKLQQTTSADLTKLFEIKEKLRSLSSFTPDLSLDEEHAVDVYDSDENLPSQYRPSSNVVGMKNLSELGIKLLRKINSGSISSSNKYQKCFNFIVQQVSNYGGTTNIDVDSIISLTTFLSMYMLVYSEDLPDKSRYHSIITKLIPRIPSIPIPELTSGNSKKEYSAILNLSTPRLLSNYINNFNDYIHDINSIALSKFNSKINSVDGVAFSDHIRQDSSAFAVHSERHVPYVNYSIYLKKVVEVMKFPDLYASVYSVLDIPGNFYDSVRRIVTTIMHPTIKVLQHGLNTTDGKIKFKFKWYV